MLASLETECSSPCQKTTGTQPEDPQDLGPLMAELMSKARLNANMGGHPSGGTGRPENEI